MRLPLSRLSLLVLLLSASAAHAQVTVTVTPRDASGEVLYPGSFLAPGDRVQLDLRAQKDETTILALQVSAVDYAANGLAFESGEATPWLFAPFCDASVPQCSGGMDPGFGTVDQQPAELNAFPGGPSVPALAYIDLPTPIPATGEQDLGLDGTTSSPHSRLFFDVVGGPMFWIPGSTIRVGAFDYGDIVGLPAAGEGTLEVIWIVPEPSTALLLGFGLSVIARRGRASAGRS